MSTFKKAQERASDDLPRVPSYFRLLFNMLRHDKDLKSSGENMNAMNTKNDGKGKTSAEPKMTKAQTLGAVAREPRPSSDFYERVSGSVYSGRTPEKKGARGGRMSASMRTTQEASTAMEADRASVIKGPENTQRPTQATRDDYRHSVALDDNASNISTSTTQNSLSESTYSKRTSHHPVSSDVLNSLIEEHGRGRLSHRETERLSVRDRGHAPISPRFPFSSAFDEQYYNGFSGGVGGDIYAATQEKRHSLRQSEERRASTIIEDIIQQIPRADMLAQGLRHEDAAHQQHHYSVLKSASVGDLELIAGGSNQRTSLFTTVDPDGMKHSHSLCDNKFETDSMPLHGRYHLRSDTRVEEFPLWGLQKPSVRPASRTTEYGEFGRRYDSHGNLISMDERIYRAPDRTSSKGKANGSFIGVGCRQEKDRSRSKCYEGFDSAPRAQRADSFGPEDESGYETDVNDPSHKLSKKPAILFGLSAVDRQSFSSESTQRARYPSFDDSDEESMPPSIPMSRPHALPRTPEKRSDESRRVAPEALRSGHRTPLRTDHGQAEDRASSFLRRATVDVVNSMEAEVPRSPPSPSLGRSGRPVGGKNPYLGGKPYKKLLDRAILPCSKSSTLKSSKRSSLAVEHVIPQSAPSVSFLGDTPVPDAIPGHGFDQSKKRRTSKKYQGSPLRFDPRNSAEVEKRRKLSKQPQLSNNDASSRVFIMQQDEEEPHMLKKSSSMWSRMTTIGRRPTMGFDGANDDRVDVPSRPRAPMGYDGADNDREDYSGRKPSAMGYGDGSRQMYSEEEFDYAESEVIEDYETSGDEEENGEAEISGPDASIGWFPSGYTGASGDDSGMPVADLSRPASPPLPPTPRGPRGAGNTERARAAYPVSRSAKELQSELPAEEVPSQEGRVEVSEQLPSPVVKIEAQSPNVTRSALTPRIKVEHASSDDRIVPEHPNTINLLVNKTFTPEKNSTARKFSSKTRLPTLQPFSKNRTTARRASPHQLPPTTSDKRSASSRRHTAEQNPSSDKVPSSRRANIRTVSAKLINKIGATFKSGTQETQATNKMDTTSKWDTQATEAMKPKVVYGGPASRFTEPHLDPDLKPDEDDVRLRFLFKGPQPEPKSQPKLKRTRKPKGVKRDGAMRFSGGPNSDSEGELDPEPLEPVPKFYEKDDVIAIAPYKMKTAPKPGYEAWFSGLPTHLKPDAPPPSIEENDDQSIEHSVGPEQPQPILPEECTFLREPTKDELKDLEPNPEPALPEAWIALPQPNNIESEGLAEAVPIFIPPKRTYRRAVSSHAFSMMEGVEPRPRCISESQSTIHLHRNAEQTEFDEKSVSATSDAESLQVLLAARPKTPAPWELPPDLSLDLSPDLSPGLDFDLDSYLGDVFPILEEDVVAEEGQDEGPTYEGLIDFFAMAEEKASITRLNFISASLHLEDAIRHWTWDHSGAPYNTSSTESYPSFKTSIFSANPSITSGTAETFLTDYSSFHHTALVTGPAILTQREPPRLARHFPSWTPHKSHFIKPHLLSIPHKIRYQIYDLLFPKRSPKPILLSPINAVMKYWPDDYFREREEFEDVIGMDSVGAVCHQLREEVLTYYLTHTSFHVTLNYLIVPSMAPWLFDWLPMFVHRIENLTIELDFTKGAGNYRDGSARLPDGIKELRQLFKMVIEPMAKRETPIRTLQIMVRRYDGIRPSYQVQPDADKDAIEGDVSSGGSYLTWETSSDKSSLAESDYKSQLARAYPKVEQWLFPELKVTEEQEDFDPNTMGIEREGGGSEKSFLESPRFDNQPGTPRSSMETPGIQGLASIPETPGFDSPLGAINAARFPIGPATPRQEFATPQPQGTHRRSGSQAFWKDFLKRRSTNATDLMESSTITPLKPEAERSDSPRFGNSPNLAKLGRRFSRSRRSMDPTPTDFIVSQRISLSFDDEPMLPMTPAPALASPQPSDTQRRRSSQALWKDFLKRRSTNTNDFVGPDTISPPKLQEAPSPSFENSPNLSKNERMSSGSSKPEDRSSGALDEPSMEPVSFNDEESNLRDYLRDLSHPDPVAIPKFEDSPAIGSMRIASPIEVSQPKMERKPAKYLGGDLPPFPSFGEASPQILEDEDAPVSRALQKSDIESRIGSWINQTEGARGPRCMGNKKFRRILNAYEDEVETRGPDAQQMALLAREEDRIEASHRHYMRFPDEPLEGFIEEDADEATMMQRHHERLVAKVEDKFRRVHPELPTMFVVVDENGEERIVEVKPLPKRESKPVEISVPYMPHDATKILDILVDHVAQPHGPGVLILRLSGFPRDYRKAVFKDMFGPDVKLKDPVRPAWPAKYVPKDLADQMTYHESPEKHGNSGSITRRPRCSHLPEVAYTMGKGAPAPETPSVAEILAVLKEIDCMRKTDPEAFYSACEDVVDMMEEIRNTDAEVYEDIKDGLQDAINPDNLRAGDEEKSDLTGGARSAAEYVIKLMEDCRDVDLEAYQEIRDGLIAAFHFKEQRTTDREESDPSDGAYLAVKYFVEMMEDLRDADPEAYTEIEDELKDASNAKKQRATDRKKSDPSRGAAVEYVVKLMEDCRDTDPEAYKKVQGRLRDAINAKARRSTERKKSDPSGGSKNEDFGVALIVKKWRDAIEAGDEEEEWEDVVGDDEAE